MRKKFNSEKLTYILVAILCIVFIGSYYYSKEMKSHSEEIKYSEFVQLAKQKKIDKVYYQKKLKDVEILAKDGNTYKLTNPENNGFKLIMMKYDLEIEEPKAYVISHSIAVFVQGLLNLYPLAMLYIFYQLMGPQFSAIDGGAEAVKNVPDIKFKDIAGLGSVKKELNFLIQFLQDPKKFEEKDVYMPSGMLLYGPPGTGKTMLAKAVAGEANVPFFTKSGSDFVELYVGNGARKVRELFKKAREAAPCIIFIDEIDALGVKRSSNANNLEANQTVNAFLAEIDGFNSKDGVFVIGATNKIEDLDEAFIRPGRFDKHICVPLPDNKEERFELFQLYSQKKTFDDDVDLDNWAKQTVWFSGADIKALINDAALKSLMAGEEAISNQSMEDAFYEILTKGHKKERTLEEQKQEAEIVAWHEAGHAIIAKMVCNISVPTVTIVGSTSGVGGFTLNVPEKTSLLTKDDLLNKVMLSYGGRAAEYLLKQSENMITTGASNDIEEATKTIKSIVTTYGMTDKFGMLNLNQLDFNKDSEILAEMQKISKDCYDKTKEFLGKNVELLRKTAELLIDEETINEAQLDELINKYKVK